MVMTKRRWVLSAVSVAAVASLTACGGSSTTPAASGSSAPSTSPASGAADSAEVTAAKAVIAPLLERPTKINAVGKITGPVPTTKPVIVITCELPQCTTLGAGAVDAAKTYGFPTKTLLYKTTDGATLTSAMRDALALKPLAVIPIGFSQALWAPLIPDFTKAGVIITSISVGDTKPGDAVTTGSASQLDYSASGASMASWVTADSGATAKILVQDVPAFAVLKAYGDGFKEALPKVCKACTIKTLDNAPAQLAANGIVPSVISALQKDPSIKYIVSTDTAFLAAGLPPALKAAGITGVKLVGGSPDINSLQGLVSGDLDAVSATAEDQYGWTAIDIILRTYNKMPVPPGDGGRVEQISTKDNVGTPTSSGLAYPTDYRDQYKALWGK